MLCLLMRGKLRRVSLILSPFVETNSICLLYIDSTYIQNLLVFILIMYSESFIVSEFSSRLLKTNLSSFEGILSLVRDYEVCEFKL